MTPASASIPFNSFPSDWTPSPQPSPSSTSFEITSPVTGPTDIWRKPSNASSPPDNEKEVRTFNSRILYKKVKTQGEGGFKRVRVTVEGKWGTLYDQGGVVLVWPGEGSEGDNIHEPTLKWIKAGIEFCFQPFIGHVACEKWADWSLTTAGLTPSGNVTIEMEKDPKAGTLWIYSIDEKSGERYPIREVTWPFGEENLTDGEGRAREVWVGVYACTPIMEGRKGERDALSVQFRDWELDVEG